MEKDEKKKFFADGEMELEMAIYVLSSRLDQERIKVNKAKQITSENLEKLEKQLLESKYEYLTKYQIPYFKNIIYKFYKFNPQKGNLSHTFTYREFTEICDVMNEFEPKKDFTDFYSNFFREDI